MKSCHPAGAKIAYFDHSAHGLKHDQFRGGNFIKKFYKDLKNSWDGNN